MELDTERVRTPEWLLGAISLLLLVDLFAAPWYGVSPTFAPGFRLLGQATSATGWQALLILGPIVLLTAVGGLAGLVCQAASRGPALPVAVITLTEGVAVIALIGLIVRVLLLSPSVLVPGTAGSDAIGTRFGAYAGLVLVILLIAACWRSLRQWEGGTTEPPPAIEVLHLARR
jgi:hypothetical protein